MIWTHRKPKINLILLNRHCLVNVWTESIGSSILGHADLKELDVQFQLIRKELETKYPKRSFTLSDHVMKPNTLSKKE